MDDYPYPIKTRFNKQHIIFGKLTEIDAWCIQKFGTSSFKKSVLTTDEWRVTYWFNDAKYATQFALRWS